MNGLWESPARLGLKEAEMTLALKRIAAFFLIVIVTGCEEGPFGNTPPQGRPDWMKDRKPANANND